MINITNRITFVVIIKKKTKTGGTDVERGTISKQPGIGIAGMITPGFRYIW